MRANIVRCRFTSEYRHVHLPCSLVTFGTQIDLVEKRELACIQVLTESLRESVLCVFTCTKMCVEWRSQNYSHITEIHNLGDY